MKKILILYATSGTGHKNAALSLEKEFAKKGVAVYSVDILDYSTPLLKAVYRDGFYHASKRAPKILDILYKQLDKRDVLEKSKRIGLFLHKINAQRFIKMLHELSPDVIVSTHFLPAALIGDLKLKGKINIPTGLVNTDYEIQNVWVQPGVDLYFVSSNLMKHQLMKVGVAREKIIVSGIPVDERFHKKISKLQAKKQIGFNRDKKLITIIQGYTGKVNLESILKEILALKRNDIELFVIANQTKRAFKAAQQTLSKKKMPSKVVPYFEEMATLLKASDILISKPGGMTVTESLISGTPLIIVSPLPGQEIANTYFLLTNGAASYAQDPDEVGLQLLNLLEDKDFYENKVSIIEKLAKPSAAKDIVDNTLKLL